jgi:hypothetical protein
MAWLNCIVNLIGPAADGTETSDPVVYINLTDTQGSFTGQWFYAAEGSQTQMLAVGLTAMNTNRQVQAGLVDPTTPYTAVERMYLTTTSAALISPAFDLAGTYAVVGEGGQPVISVNANYLSIDMSAFQRSTATGTILDRSHIIVNFPADKVNNVEIPAQTFTAQLIAPPLAPALTWSNGTFWKKQ